MSDYSMPDDTDIYQTAELFSALADSTRLKILFSLAERDMNVGALVELLGISQTAASHQLRLLRDRGLVMPMRDGKQIVYSFADEHVRSLILVGLEHVSE